MDFTSRLVIILAFCSCVIAIPNCTLNVPIGYARSNPNQYAVPNDTLCVFSATAENQARFHGKPLSNLNDLPFVKDYVIIKKPLECQMRSVLASFAAGGFEFVKKVTNYNTVYCPNGGIVISKRNPNFFSENGPMPPVPYFKIERWIKETSGYGYGNVYCAKKANGKKLTVAIESCAGDWNLWYKYNNCTNRKPVILNTDSCSVMKVGGLPNVDFSKYSPCRLIEDENLKYEETVEEMCNSNLTKSSFLWKKQKVDNWEMSIRVQKLELGLRKFFQGFVSLPPNFAKSAFLKKVTSMAPEQQLEFVKRLNSSSRTSNSSSAIRTELLTMQLDFAINRNSTRALTIEVFNLKQIITAMKRNFPKMLHSRRRRDNSSYNQTVTTHNCVVNVRPCICADTEEWGGVKNGRVVWGLIIFIVLFIILEGALTYVGIRKGNIVIAYSFNTKK